MRNNGERTAEEQKPKKEWKNEKKKNREKKIKK